MIRATLQLFYPSRRGRLVPSPLCIVLFLGIFVLLDMKLGLGCELLPMITCQIVIYGIELLILGLGYGYKDESGSRDPSQYYGRLPCVSENSRE